MATAVDQDVGDVNQEQRGLAPGDGQNQTEQASQEEAQIEEKREGERANLDLRRDKLFAGWDQEEKGDGDDGLEQAKCTKAGSDEVDQGPERFIAGLTADP